MRSRRHVLRCRVDRLPLQCTCRALHKLVLIVEQHVKITHVPFDWSGRPSPFEAAGDGMVAKAALVAAGPAETLLCDVRSFGFGPNLGWIPCTVAFTERVAAGR